MRRRIFKYPLEKLDTDQRVDMPQGAKVRHTGMQNGRITIWADVNADQAPETRRFIVRGTGHDIREGAEFVGTVMDGPFVWHLFEML